MIDSLAALINSQRLADSLPSVIVGVVTSNQDPDGLGRIKVRFPSLSNDDESAWARVVMPMAGAGRGVYFIPEVDDEVLVAFEYGQVEFPYVLGCVWNGVDKPPEAQKAGNDRRTIQSRSGHVIRMDDTADHEKLEIVGHGGSTSIVLDTSNNTITIVAKGDISVQTSDGKLLLQGKGIELVSKAAVKIQADQDLEITASGQMKLKASTIDLN